MGGGPSIVFKPFKKVIELAATPLAPLRPEVQQRSIAQSETRPLKKTEPKTTSTKCENKTKKPINTQTIIPDRPRPGWGFQCRARGEII